MCTECGCGLPDRPEHPESTNKKEVQVLKNILEKLSLVLYLQIVILLF